MSGCDHEGPSYAAIEVGGLYGDYRTSTPAGKQ
jgi:hypothetical protein